jgi:hypothetical protein
MHILQRGDVFQSGASVRAGGIVGLGDQADFGLTDSAGDGERRVALAAWITTANRALLARVLVNRVWHYHFGCGIVETPNDFGFNGARPSHPELLDELASRWIADGMHWKSLHRTIVLSRTYRSSSRPDPRSLEIDRNNRWLWRYPVRRLEGEAVRDSMLAISGLLRSPMGGPGFQDVEIRENNGTTYYHPKHQETPDCYRRTVYRFSPRCERNPILDGLDCPDPSAAAPRRATTTTPLQALSLLNNPFVFTSADALVERIAHRDRDARPESHEAWVQALFHLVLLRDAEEGELRDAVELVRAHGPSALARSLWNTNEFLVLE